MMHIKIFTEDFPVVLEDRVNEFINGKHVMSISYAVNDGKYSCCIVYQEWVV